VVFDFSEAAYRVCESENMVTVCATIVNGESATPIPFNLRTVPGTANGMLYSLIKCSGCVVSDKVMIQRE